MPRIIQNITFFLFSISSLFASQINGQADSLQQIWVSDSQPDSSRFKALNEYAIKYSYSDPDLVKEFSIYHFELAQQKKSKEEMAKALDNKALILCVIGKYDDALKEMNQVIEIMSSLNDTIGMAAKYANMGTVYYYQHKYQEAVQLYMKSLAMYEDKNLEFQQAEVLNNLGLIYFDINNLDLALEYYNRAHHLYRKLEIEDKMGNVSLHKGYINLKRKEYHQAIENGRKALEIFKSSSHQISIAESYSLFAQAYQELNEIDTAIFYIKKSIQVGQNIGNNIYVLSDKIILANLIFETDINQAIRIGEEILPSIDNIPGYEAKAKVHKLLYKCYKKKGNLSRALAMHEKFVNYNDSLLVESDNISVIRKAIQTEYEIKLYNEKIENEQVQSQLKLNQLKRTFILLFASSIIILLIIFYTRSNIISQRKEKEVLLKEIKHLKSIGNSSINLSPQGFKLHRDKIEESIDRKMNETDWKVLNILLDDPVISNKEIAKKAFLTVDGIGSCLRRMYLAFDIKESKYKKISLLMKAIKLSTN